MAVPSDDILITESHNMGDEPSLGPKEKAIKENEGASIRTMEKQGIFLESENEPPTRTKPRDELSKELEDMGGIEIIPSGDSPD